MKHLSLLAAAAMLVAGAQLHAQTVPDSAHKAAAKHTAKAAHATVKPQGTAIAKTATKPAAKAAKTADSATAKPKAAAKTARKHTTKKTAVKKDSAAKQG